LNIEDLLPSARPKNTRFAFKVVKPGILWRLEEIDESRSLPPARKNGIEWEKIDPTEKWWI